MTVGLPDARAYRRTRLPDGVRVVTVHRPGSGLTALKLFMKVGSRHDGPHPGIAHFVEHVLLGNTTSAAARTAYDTAESLGGELNAVTTREYTALQAVVPAGYSERMVQLFGDLLEPSLLDPVAVARERAVIRQEMRLEADSVQVLWDLFLTALWNGHPLARPVLGTEESVDAMSAGALAERARGYRDPDRMVLAAAGDVDHVALCTAVAARWGGLPPGPPAAWDGALAAEGAAREREATPASRRVRLDRSSLQTHLAIGTEGLPMSDPRRHALRLLEIVLGRGASSRLHRTLRTERGLVYSVSTVAMSYEDRGYVAVTTSCVPENAAAVEQAIRDALQRVADADVREDELARAKMIYEGSLARQFETALSLASITGIEELLDHIEPLTDSLALVKALPADALRAVAAHLFTPERVAVATVGRETWQRTPATTP